MKVGSADAAAEAEAIGARQFGQQTLLGKIRLASVSRDAASFLGGKYLPFLTTYQNHVFVLSRQ